MNPTRRSPGQGRPPGFRPLPFPLGPGETPHETPAPPPPRIVRGPFRGRPPGFRALPFPLGPPASPVPGGVQFDAATGFGVDSVSTAWDFAHVCTGANRVLYLEFQFNADPGAITAVQYNGVSLTLLASRTLTQFAYLYRLASPASGSNTVHVAWTNARNGVSIAWSYAGVDPATPESNLTTETDGDEQITVSPTSGNGRAVYALLSTVNLTAGALTERKRATGSSGATGAYVGDNPGTGGGVTGGWSSTGLTSYLAGFNVNAVPVLQPVLRGVLEGGLGTLYSKGRMR